MAILSFFPFGKKLKYRVCPNLSTKPGLLQPKSQITDYCPHTLNYATRRMYISIMIKTNHCKIYGKIIAFR